MHVEQSLLPRVICSITQHNSCNCYAAVTSCNCSASSPGFTSTDTRTESIKHDGLIILSKEGNNNGLTIDQEIEYRCHDIISTISHNFKE